MEPIMDNGVQTLSGGELQRCAIVLCLGTAADIYLVDEPSAYLDSEQRIAASKVCSTDSWSWLFCLSDIHDENQYAKLRTRNGYLKVTFPGTDGSSMKSLFPYSSRDNICNINIHLFE